MIYAVCWRRDNKTQCDDFPEVVDGFAGRPESAARAWAMQQEHDADHVVDVYEVTDHFDGLVDLGAHVGTYHARASLAVHVRPYGDGMQTGDYPPAADLVRDALRDATATAERLRCERDAALSALHTSIAARRGLTWRQRLRALFTGEVA